ncbi:MAG: hypothetical protein PHF86_02585 [Candidatus Nanoarchaeia archaeon]|nr:hypothetical protein [Candidatus Nanoarchaeia archaeon]
MIDIIQIALLEKAGELDKGKTEYIQKISGSFNFRKYLKDENIDKKSQEKILSEISQQIFNDLRNRVGETNFYDAVGIWITIGDKVLENSLDLSVLENIQQFGEPGIVPIFEFIKMTLDQHESKIN